MYRQVVTEAFVVGVILAVVGILFIQKFNFTSLFILGFGFHIVCEFTGVNRWYCKYGSACSSR